MSNGYKPAPLDLSHVKLTPNQNQLVEKLAENGHNVWARDRVRQGWTYSIVQVTSAYALVNPAAHLVIMMHYLLFSEQFNFIWHVFFHSQDIFNKRNPRLVPYNLLDERTKKTNRDSVNNAVRTLIGYGYNIEPPDQEGSKFRNYLSHDKL